MSDLAREDEINGKPVDRFTFGHAALGGVLAVAGVSAPAALAVAVIWELVETPAKRARPDLFPNPSADTAANAVLDVAAVMIGWGIARSVTR